MSALNAFAYGLSSIYNNFSQIYIRTYHGTVETGLLLSIGPIVAMAAPFLWGMLADRARSRKSVFLAVTAGSAVGFAMLGFSRSFWSMAVSLLIFMFFFSPLTGLNDLLSVEGCAVSGADYGRRRIFGTLFYGLLPLAIAPITQRDINFIFVAYGLVTALCAVSVFPVPERTAEKKNVAETHTPAEQRKDRRFYSVVFHDRKLIMMLLMAFVANFSFACVLIYYPEYLTSTLGLPQSSWAAVVMATVIGEIPLFLFYDKIVKRLGIKYMLLIGLTLSMLRMASYMVFRSSALIIITSAVTGFGITLLTYSILIYVTENYERGRRSKVMNFIYGLGTYAPRALAGIAAGGFVNLFGVPSLMLAASVMSAASFVFYIVFVRSGS